MEKDNNKKVKEKAESINKSNGPNNNYNKQNGKDGGNFNPFSFGNNNGNKNKYFIYYAIGILVIMMVINVFFAPFSEERVTYSEFEALGQSGVIEEVQISEAKILFYTGKGSEVKAYYTDRIDDPDLINKLQSWDVEKYGGVSESNSAMAEILLSWILPLGFFIFMGRMIMRMTQNMGGAGSRFGNIGKSTAKEYDVNEDVKVTFKDVAGQEEAKESLKEIVAFLNEPEKFTQIGAKLPKGELLVGPPGTGKTMLAKAVAGEANVPFYSISGSEFVQMFVGMGAARVRDLFKQAKEKAPAIIFIDEIDAIGKSRDGMGGLGGNDEREQTLNQLLSEMDGFESKDKPIVILAATNRPEILDKALLRPGRFDRRVIVSKPDFDGRLKILQVHSKGVLLDSGVKLEGIAKMTAGSSGADLANIVNEAALRAIRKNHLKVSQQDLEESVEVIFAGEAKRDRIMSEKEKIAVAYHETGHALAGALLENADPVSKITIVPTTMGALGYTMQLPSEEKYLISKEDLEAQLVVMLAGRAAEEVKMGQMSTGAANDIERATQMARRMVTMYGMSERFDMMGLESSSNQYLDGTSVKNYSEATGQAIDDEVLKIIKKAHVKAIKLLNENRALLDEVAWILMTRETIRGEEFYKIIEEHKTEKSA